MIGQRFGRLTVIADAGHGFWRCRCDCGKENEPSASTLRSGRVKSCGCWREERKITHGKSGTPVYQAWRSMMKRCNDPNNAQYHNYGARGIKVCSQWSKFENFYADMGDKPEGHSLDRIDNDGNYELGNCRWATQKAQIRNKRNTARIELDGEMVSLAEVCEQRGLKLRRVRQRLAAGMSVEKALMPGKHSRWRQQ